MPSLVCVQHFYRLIPTYVYSYKSFQTQIPISSEQATRLLLHWLHIHRGIRKLSRHWSLSACVYDLRHVSISILCLWQASLLPNKCNTLRARELFWWIVLLKWQSDRLSRPICPSAILYTCLHFLQPLALVNVNYFDHFSNVKELSAPNRVITVESTVIYSLCTHFRSHTSCSLGYTFITRRILCLWLQRQYVTWNLLFPHNQFCFFT